MLQILQHWRPNLTKYTSQEVKENKYIQQEKAWYFHRMLDIIKGIGNYESGNYTGAIKYYDKALAVRPNYIVALNNKGLALSGLGNYTGAIKYYDKALAINPNYVEGLNNKGLALSGLGNYTGSFLIQNYFILRIYLPAEEVLNGTWTPPITRQ